MQTYLALDVVAALGTLAAVGFFLRAWLRSRAALHLLLALGFALVAASYPFVAWSHLGEQAGAADGVRFVGQTGGALVLALAYVASHGGRAASPLHVLGWSAAACALVGLALALLVPAGAAGPTEGDIALVAHATQSVCFATCAALAASAFRRHMTLDRAIVPAAFVLWAIGKALWVAIDLGASDSLLPLVYGCRLGAVSLLLLALALPVTRSRRDGGRGHGGDAA